MGRSGRNTTSPSGPSGHLPMNGEERSCFGLPHPAASPPTSPASGEVKLLPHNPPPALRATPHEWGGALVIRTAPPGGFAADLPGERGGEACCDKPLRPFGPPPHEWGGAGGTRQA